MLRARDLEVPWRGTPVLMGIVNANDDSFSDPGGRAPGSVLARCVALVAEGATMLDLGAQSAITGRAPVGPDAEAAALVPAVAEAVRRFPGVVVSVDTFKASVAEAVLAAGAHMINDVSGLADLAVAEACARWGAALVVMHTAAPPLVRRQDPSLYRDVAAEVAAFLALRVAAAERAGVRPESLVVDPGVDFAKTPAQSLALLGGIGAVVALGRPVLLAISRKDFLGALTGRPPAERGPATLGAVAALRHVPHQILRLHDVGAARDFLAVHDQLVGGGPVDPGLALADGLRHQPLPAGPTRG